jgi:hypothetical protein
VTAFVKIIPEDPEYGPPCPLSCPEGWESHTWMIEIDCGAISLHIMDCPICERGISDLEQDYLMARFLAKIEFHKETYGGYDSPQEVDVWWDIIPEGTT